MAQSDTQICNLALSHAGQSIFIQSLAEQSKEAALCKFHYEQCRDETLAHHLWGFAKAAKILALTANEPPVQWAYEYAAPNDSVRIFTVYSDLYDQRRERPPEFEMRSADGGQSRVIWTNVQQARADYVRQVEAESVYPPAFVNALSLLIASRIAKPLTGDQSIANTLYEKHRMALSAARTDDQNAKNYDYTAWDGSQIVARQ